MSRNRSKKEVKAPPVLAPSAEPPALVPDGTTAVKPPRIRATVFCPLCEKPAYVTRTLPPDESTAYPEFITSRVRYYKCGSCSHNFKG